MGLPTTVLGHEAISSYGRETFSICRAAFRPVVEQEAWQGTVLIMASFQDKDIKAGTGITNIVADNGIADVGIGSVEERPRSALSTFFRSVLFQMIMFGA